MLFAAGPVPSAIGAIVITGGKDIIIEDCDISDWGRLDPKTGFGFNYESAIFSRSASLQRLVVQRCKLHDPSFDGSNWYEPTHPTHSRGPRCISLFNAGGNHVIRYNECWSDLEHMFNDIIGGEHWMTGQIFVFHNTIFQSDEWLPTGASAAAESSSTRFPGITSRKRSMTMPKVTAIALIAFLPVSVLADDMHRRRKTCWPILRAWDTDPISLGKWRPGYTTKTQTWIMPRTG